MEEFHPKAAQALEFRGLRKRTFRVQCVFRLHESVICAEVSSPLVKCSFIEVLLRPHDTTRPHNSPFEPSGNTILACEAVIVLVWIRFFNLIDNQLVILIAIACRNKRICTPTNLVTDLLCLLVASLRFVARLTFAIFTPALPLLPPFSLPFGRLLLYKSFRHGLSRGHLGEQTHTQTTV